MLFGVPDEITDMTRSLEMVERERQEGLSSPPFTSLGLSKQVDGRTRPLVGWSVSPFGPLCP